MCFGRLAGKKMSVRLAYWETVAENRCDLRGQCHEARDGLITLKLFICINKFSLHKIGVNLVKAYFGWAGEIFPPTDGERLS